MSSMHFENSQSVILFVIGAFPNQMLILPLSNSFFCVHVPQVMSSCEALWWSASGRIFIKPDISAAESDLERLQTGQTAASHLL